MAKSARASSNKTNKSHLRARVFSPIEAARLERLAKKQQEIVASAKPERAEMQVDKFASTTAHVPNRHSKAHNLPDNDAETTSNDSNATKTQAGQGVFQLTSVDCSMINVDDQTKWMWMELPRTRRTAPREACGKETTDTGFRSVAIASLRIV